MTRQNDHMRAEELISAYLDNQVTAAEKQFFERHLASCADCRAQLEVTRSMVTALRAMPTVKAPRSFVLPRALAKQPKRSIFAWYPALRLATVVAAIVFMIVFAGDLLTTRTTSQSVSMSLPAAAPLNQALPMEKSSDTMAATALPPTAALQIGQALAPTASAPAAAGAPAASGPTSADTSMRSAATVTETTTYSNSTAGAGVLTATSLPTATPATMATAEATALAAMPPAAAPSEAGQVNEATSESAETRLDQQAAPPAAQPVPLMVTEPAMPTINPLHVVEIALLALAIVLGIATLIVRRKQA